MNYVAYEKIYQAYMGHQGAISALMTWVSAGLSSIWVYSASNRYNSDRSNLSPAEVIDVCMGHPFITTGPLGLGLLRIPK